MDLTDIDLAALVEAVAEVAQGRAADRERLARRDGLIRAYLAAGVPYRLLEEATGLTRSTLNLIRLQS